MAEKIALIVFFLFSLGFNIWSQSTPSGTWKSIDDATGEAKSYVKLYEEGGKIYGKIVKLLAAEPDAKCDKCKGDKYNQPVLGMQIIDGLSKQDDYWRKGKILDPESGSEYKCSIWFENGNSDELKVRGYHWTGLYRTQTWYRVE